MVLYIYIVKKIENERIIKVQKKKKKNIFTHRENDFKSDIGR